MRLLIVGNRGGTNVGERFETAAADLGLEARLLPSSRAMVAPAWLRHVNWHLRGRRPTRLATFGREVVEACRAWRPAAVLATGLAPLDAGALARIGALGVRRLNYLTDDPWNPVHRARWFLQALPGYDVVFSPRRANLADLTAAGVAEVRYLPFAYDPALHFPDPGPSPAGAGPVDVLFVGGGDADRAPLMAALAEAGLRVALYGQYWERFAGTRALTRGQAPPAVIRRATSLARVAIGLPRRANRDGHTMRSLEIPASGGCLLAEDTGEHRELFGPDGQAAAYFGSGSDLVSQASRLVADEAERERLALAGHRLVTGGRHTYRDRLAAIVAAAGARISAAAGVTEQACR